MSHKPVDLTKTINEAMFAPRGQTSTGKSAEPTTAGLGGAPKADQPHQPPPANPSINNDDVALNAQDLMTETAKINMETLEELIKNELDREHFQ